LKPIVLIVSLVSFTLFAQNKVILSGVVNSSTAQEIKGASVRVVLNKQVFNAITDSVGVFLLKIPKGVAAITVSSLGYYSENQDISIQKDTLLSFFIKEENTVLNEVVVARGGRKQIKTIAGGKLSFDPHNLSMVPNLTGTVDIIKLLQLTPGVQNSGEANGYLYVRGGEPGHNLMLYADAPVYGMAHLLGVFPFYNADPIHEIQFDKSSSNARFGGRLSSTVYVTPFREIPDEISIQGNVGLLASQLTLAVPISKKTGLFVSGRKTYIDKIIGPLLTPRKNNDNDVKGLNYGFSDGNLTFISDVSRTQRFVFDAFISGDVLKMSDSNLGLDARLKWSNVVLTPSWKSILSEKVTMVNSVFFSRYENSLVMRQETVQMDISSYVEEFGFTNKVNYTLWEVPFESGLQCAYYELQPQNIEIENIKSIATTGKSFTTRSSNYAAFAMAKPKLLEMLSVEIGLRLNYYYAGAESKPNHYFQLEPRITLNYSPTTKDAFFATYTRQNQYLNLVTTSSVGIPTDFWVASGNGIPSQAANSFSGGYSRIFTKEYNVSLDGFYRTMHNLIEYPYGVTQFNEISTLENDLLVGNGEAYGAEFMFKKERGKLKGWLSYTMSWTIRQFDEINEGRAFYSKYDRRHNLALVGTYDFNSKWSAGVTQIFSSGNRFTMPTTWYFINNNPVKEYGSYNNAVMPNYFRTDLSVNYWLVKTAKKESALSISVYNALNISNPVYVVFNVNLDEEGRSVSVSQEEKKLYGILPSLSWRFKF